MRLPAIDERLVMPETRHEVIEGKVVYVSPAEPPHAIRHSKVSALLEAFVAPGYEVASDMLTRTSERGDMAPDASVFPAAPDPETGGRQLERLAFEVVSTETLPAAGRKAAALTSRGVARVFAVDVRRLRALEWSRPTRGWEILADAATIVDVSLAAPLPVHDLVHAAKADDAMARALLAKRNPVLLEALAAAEDDGEARGRVEGETRGRVEGEARGRAEGEARGRAEGEARGRAEGEARGRAEGEARGRAEALLAVLAGRGLRVSVAQADRIRATRDIATLDRWLTGAGGCATVAALLGARRPTPRTRRRG